tara:strand:+ start:4655 stop:5125 length:471 start_codon:yes stop_codon:yes gene_type:complete
MKNYLITIFILTLTINGFTQTKDAFEKVKNESVPAEVISTFEEMYPTIKNPEWRSFRDRFEAKFKWDNHWYFERFNQAGLYTERRVLKDWNEAPQKLIEAKSKTSQKHWDVIEYYTRSNSTGQTSYILQLQNKDGELQTLYFDENASLETKSKAGY